jgi:putative (di)nucleoside polyphosphate hydrolase
MSIHASLPYRPCVGIMLLNKNGHVFTGHRVNTPTEAWQMPQGGIGGGEDVQKAALRELEEENGISKSMVEIIAQTEDWLFYDLPDQLVGEAWGGKYKGQKQIWFLMRFLGEDEVVNLEAHEPEFSEWKWLEPEDLPNMVVPFKKKLYEEVLKNFKSELQK